MHSAWPSDTTGRDMLLTGWVPQGLALSDNPYISGDVDSLAPDAIVGWPPAESAMQRLPAQPLALQLPVSAPQQRALGGQLQRRFSDDYYHRVHSSPQQLDLGNVASTQTTPVFIWNAHLVPQSLSEIGGLDEGLDVSGQPAPPLLFTALQEREYQVSVTPDGQPVLDTLLSWVFANGEQPGLRITANRIIAWAFAPDWGQGVQEQLEWLTDVLASESQAEQRRALRTAPRRELSAPMYVEGRERQLLDLALFGWGSRIWALPIWPDIQRLGVDVPAESLSIPCATEYLDFRAGGLAMLRAETAFHSEVVEIDSVDAGGLTLKRPTLQAWPVGTRLYPVRTAQLMQQPDLVRLTDQLMQADVTFQVMEACDWPALDVAELPAYRGWPVLELRPDETEDLTHQFERLLLTLDSRTALPLVTDVAGRAMPITDWRWVDLGRAERAWLRSLLYYLRGRQRAVWVPTHADDLTVVAATTDTSLTIDVANVGYSRFGLQRVGRRDIRIELVDGQVLYRRITGASEIDAEVERLAIDSALGVTVAPSAIARVCWLVLSRGSADRVTLDHITDSEGAAAAQVTFRGVRDDDLQ